MAIELPTGPEVLTGSTRLKAGTSQKLVLNMLSTAAFTRLGKTYGNLMVDMQAKNKKLGRRSRRIVSEAAACPEAEAEDLLFAANGSAKVALVMGRTGLTASAARTLFDEAHGKRAPRPGSGGGRRSRRTLTYLCVDRRPDEDRVVLMDEGRAGKSRPGAPAR